MFKKAGIWSVVLLFTFASVPVAPVQAADVPDISFSTDALTVTEGEDISITVELSATTTEAVSFALAFSDTDEHEAASGSDVKTADVAETRTIPAGEESVTFTVETIDDDIFEETETVLFSFAGASLSGAVDIGTTMLVTIEDNDEVFIPEVSFSEETLAVTEGDDISVVVELSGEAEENVTYQIALDDSATHTATVDEDYSGTLFASTLTILKGSTQATAIFSGIDDDEGEGNETFTLTLTNISDNAVGTDSTLEVTIEENELPTIGFSLSESSIYESYSSVNGIYSVLVELSHDYPEDVSFKRNLKDADDHTATKNDDYEWASDNPHSIPAGETTTTVDITILEDDVEEGDEWFMIRLRNNGLVNAVRDEDAKFHTVTILDNDGAFEPTRTDEHILNEDKTEEAVSVDIDSDFYIYVEFDYSDGTTSSVGGIFQDIDFQFYDSEGAAMDMGQPDSSSALNVSQSYSAGFFGFQVPSTVHDDRDSYFIPGKTYTLSLVDNKDTEDTSDDEVVDSLTVMVNNLVSFGEDTSSVDEDYGDGEAMEVIAISNETDEEITFDFTLSGTATYDSDFVFVTGTRFSETTSITIPGGAGTAFPIAFLDDLADEEDETIIITITSATYVESGTTIEIDPITHTLTILDNDENNAPTPVVDEDGTSGVPDQSLTIGEVKTLSRSYLEGRFTDIDEDTFTISVTNNTNDLIATAVLSEAGDLALTGFSEGTTTVTLTVDDGEEGIVEDTFNIVVTTPTETAAPTSSGGGSGVQHNTPPSADILSGGEVTVLVNTELTFDASDSQDAEGNIQFYFWNFGDGTEEVYAQVPTITHTYTATGTFALAIRVRDSFGAEDTATISVIVVDSAEDVPDTTPDGSTTEPTVPDTEEDTAPSDDTTEPGDADTTVPAEDDTTAPAEDTTDTPADTTEPGTDTPPSTDDTTDTTDTTTDTDESEDADTTTEDDTTTPETEEEVSEEGEDEGLPTWIRIIFGSGAVAALAGAGIAVNRVRKTLG